MVESCFVQHTPAVKLCLRFAEFYWTIFSWASTWGTFPWAEVTPHSAPCCEKCRRPSLGAA
eukprot:3361678-Ditylum_brightwellii.AAC.1